MIKLIKDLRQDFIREAINSPVLLSDLASMEKYIAESYQERSVIELLQNADDAGATNFYIHKINNYVIVANDGRSFNSNDAIAICRSGSSSKKRDGRTIGYRGIGFKSVVNFATRVHILSSEVKMTFSKELTSELLNSDVEVPLIRIPHEFNPIDKSIEGIMRELITAGYRTIFIFEKIYSHILDSELSNFDPSSLIFLKNITNVMFENDHNQQCTSISSKRIQKENKQNVQIKWDGTVESWFVVHGTEESDAAVAFLTNEHGNIIPVDNHRAVVHAFMPTKELVGFPIKINGDFSTDPSRTKVTLDDFSNSTTENCLKIILDLVKETLSGPQQPYFLSGIFEVLSILKNDYIQFNSNSNRFKDRFLGRFKEVFNNSPWFQYNNKFYDTKQLRVNSEWLNYIDFQEICKKTGIVPISKELEAEFPCLIQFSKSLNVRELSLEEILSQLMTYIPSLTGGVEVFTRSIEQYRFSLDSTKIDLIKKANLVKFITGFVPFEKVSSKHIIDNEYNELLLNRLLDINDMKWFIKKLNIHIDGFQLGSDNDIESKISNPYEKINNSLLNSTGVNNSSSSDIQPADNTFIANGEIKHYRTSISKWRSAEKNLASCLENDDGVLKVIDVSKSNLGYDLEVYTPKGTLCIEVKSVKKMGETISITNNEYSTANQLTDQYMIAIVKQSDDEIEVCFISNPINMLSLTKRVTQWEWIADEYSGRKMIYKY